MADMKNFRLIVCIDIDARTLRQAYAYMSEQLGRCDFCWETSDEWYDNADADHPGDPEELTKAICDVIWQREEESTHG